MKKLTNEKIIYNAIIATMKQNSKKEIMKKTAESVLLSARENDEPVFILRAKDQCALATLLKYEAECKENECDINHIQGIVDIIDDFANWREVHSDQIKKPD